MRTSDIRELVLAYSQTLQKLSIVYAPTKAAQRCYQNAGEGRVCVLMVCNQQGVVHFVTRDMVDNTPSNASNRAYYALDGYEGLSLLEAKLKLLTSLGINVDQLKESQKRCAV